MRLLKSFLIGFASAQSVQSVSTDGGKKIE